ncbi:related to ribosomal large subunit pseudouridine synthase D [Desulfotalea psychrophila LSv54]|uniref:Pseudouridine synthase n=1 Tax=Desulfotalea psychrophila (strain LSv54 / DSM 12343) TaxID=177439 RepID=Q6AJM1_DESPS|nr:related to ribosomal large subunit pseudouridine synthase D [Desulfotalea psychrophila LSv54]
MLPLSSENIENSVSDQQKFEFSVSYNQRGTRLDQFLAFSLPDVSRALITLSNKKELVLVDDEVKKSSYRLKEGETVTCALWQAPPLSLEPQQVDFESIYEDDSLLVLSKPPGIVVHPGNGNTEGTLVHGLLYHCREIGGVGDAIRPGIVHRLDKDTSGAMVVAKDERSLRTLVDSFKERQVYKVYHALVCGIPKKYEGRIVAPIGRHSVHRQKMAISERTGKFAATNWQVVEVFETKDGPYSLLRVHIETGRTHQIRVHMSSIGCPIAGDQVYGSKRQNPAFARQMLHASRLRLPHPVTGRTMSFTAPLWQDFQEVLEDMDWSGALE